MSTLERKKTRKMLESQLAVAKAEAESSKALVTQYQREYDVKRQTVQSLQDKIRLLGKDEGLRVSEHAYVRYFERIEGYDLAEIESKILTDEVKRLVDVLGTNGEYPLGTNSIVMKDGVVVTIK
jgi:hypothetical protein